jgi:hypothetical protein
MQERVTTMANIACVVARGCVCQGTSGVWNRKSFLCGAEEHARRREKFPTLGAATNMCSGWDLCDGLRHIRHRSLALSLKERTVPESPGIETDVVKRQKRSLRTAESTLISSQVVPLNFGGQKRVGASDVVWLSGRLHGAPCS